MQLCVQCCVPAQASCGGCQKARYCSEKCQQIHWTFHQTVCLGTKKPELVFIASNGIQYAVPVESNILLLSRKIVKLPARLGQSQAIKVDLSNNPNLEYTKGLFSLQEVFTLDLSLTGPHAQIPFPMIMPRLNVLLLADIGLKELPDFSTLPSLGKLDLSQNKLKYAHFPAMPNLRTLDVSFNKLSEISFEALPGIQKLKLDHNELSTFHLQRYNELEQVDLSNNGLVNFDAEERQMLAELRLNDNPELNPFSALAKIRSYAILNVSDTNLMTLPNNLHVNFVLGIWNTGVLHVPIGVMGVDGNVHARGSEVSKYYRRGEYPMVRWFFNQFRAAELGLTILIKRLGVTPKQARLIWYCFTKDKIMV